MAQRNLGKYLNCHFHQAAVDAIPLAPDSLDFCYSLGVLHHVPDPTRALAEVARVLKPGGRLILVDMLSHDRESYRQQMGHVWLGFSDDHVRQMLTAAGFSDIRIITLPPDARAKGPGLFVVTARRD